MKLKHRDILKNIENESVKTELIPIEMILVPDDGVQNSYRPVLSRFCNETFCVP